MKLILINGQPGAGKTSIAKKLLSELNNAAYIEGDSITSVNPFEFNDTLDNLGIANAVSLVRNFSKFGYANVILSGLLRDQGTLDIFLRELNKEVDVLFVWLRASKEIRMARKKERGRDEADESKHFDFVDSLIPNIESIEVKNGKAIFIDTTSKTIDEVVREIKNHHGHSS